VRVQRCTYRVDYKIEAIDREFGTVMVDRGGGGGVGEDAHAALEAARAGWVRVRCSPLPACCPICPIQLPFMQWTVFVLVPPELHGWSGRAASREARVEWVLVRCSRLSCLLCTFLIYGGVLRSALFAARCGGVGAGRAA
jgi:hypothetical protein